MAWLLATKLEMTRVVKDDRLLAVTLLQIPELRVVWIKTMEKDGYSALVLGVLDNKETETVLWEGKTTLSKNVFTTIKEFIIAKEDEEKYKAGDVVSLDILEWVDTVSIEWISKWKWFTWAMKKHNFHGWPAGHGSKFHRALGSIGNRKPTRTHKWKKMHGHHWNIKVTIKKVPVDIVNKELSVIWVRGWVPGARNSLVKIVF